MFKTRKIAFGLAAAFALLLSVPAMGPARADDACNAAVADIGKATATLDALKQLGSQITARQTALAAGGGGGEWASTEPYKCPACGMMMPTKPTGNLTKAVKYGGKTYYCCKGCDMSATADK